jgi:hypothetical protein
MILTQIPNYLETTKKHRGAPITVSQETNCLLNSSSKLVLELGQQSNKGTNSGLAYSGV